MSGLPAWLSFDFMYERFRDRVAGLTDDELSWVPADGVTTIAWRLGHITDGLSEERNWLWLGRQIPDGLPPRDQRFEHAADAVAAFEAAYGRWVELTETLTPADLERPLGPVAGPYGADPVAAFIVHMLDELIHHTAEIALLRDLFAAFTTTRSPGRP